MATHSSILARRIPWTEEPGGLQSMGSQRVGHKWTWLTHTNTLKEWYSIVFVLFKIKHDDTVHDWNLLINNINIIFSSMNPKEDLQNPAY